MDKDIKPYVITEGYIEDHRTDGLRSGEGCVASLDDGSLLIIYGRFEGPGDADKATLIERRSTDGGKRWSRAKALVRPPKDAQNVMSVSLLRLSDGRLAGLYLLKKSSDYCMPMFMTSDGCGKGWTQPQVTIDRPGYYVVNNDRLVQLSTGRILIPYCWYNRAAPGPFNGFCGCAMSDDLGRAWRRGAEIQIQAEHVQRPKLVDETNPAALKDVSAGRVACQEPGVQELLDGRVMMWCRTPGGYAYRALSTDGGQTWGPFEPITDFAMPCGPQSIRRLPGSRRLIMLFNDRGGVPYGHPQFQWRRPLAIAVSDDDALTWRRHGLLEPDTIPTHCYYSICFHQGAVLFTYYEGVMRATPEGFYVPR
ncbi:MAG TPA: sialidase family protein, partial [Candidatus Brocadiia bacterium]|nr:sialidase family protein [Candidatus Brocadiia bacterium]